MTVFLLLIVVVVIGLTAALALGRLGGAGVGMAEPTSAQGFVPLPEGRLEPDEIHGLGFDRAFRGYRMDQVDDVIDRLRDELRERDDELADLADLGGQHRRAAPTSPRGLGSLGDPGDSSGEG